MWSCCTAVATTPPASTRTPDQWATIADVLAARQLLPLVDFAYQGFAEGHRPKTQLGDPRPERPGERDADRQLVLQELRPLQRAGRRADPGRGVAGRGECGAQPDQEHHPRQLLQPAGARRQDRHHDPAVARAAGRLGGRGGRDARAHSPDAAALRPGTGSAAASNATSPSSSASTACSRSPG